MCNFVLLAPSCLLIMCDSMECVHHKMICFLYFSAILGWETKYINNILSSSIIIILSPRHIIAT